VKSFLSKEFKNEIKKRKYYCYQLYLSIKSQLNVLESGLTVHNRVIKNLISTNQNDNNYDNMIELNKHLSSCLNLLNSELDEFI
jgi:hypothetical protein